MKLHTDLLNSLISLHGLTRYLEIGVQHPKNNFDLIAAPTNEKYGVDPVPFGRLGFLGTSDEFFDYIQKYGGGVVKYDLIFIDGLHHADQVQKDFENALRCLTERGFIVLHDTLPESEHITHVPRDKRGRWLGDVYKFIMLLNGYDGIDFYTEPFDNGCTVVWRDASKKGNPDIAKLEPITWATYEQNRHLMRVAG